MAGHNNAVRFGGEASVPMGRVLLVLAALAAWAAMLALVLFHAPFAFASAPGPGTLEAAGAEADPDVRAEGGPAAERPAEAADPAGVADPADPAQHADSPRPPEQSAEMDVSAFDDVWCSQLGPWSARFNRDSVEAAKRAARERDAVDKGSNDASQEPASDGRAPMAAVFAVASLGAGLACLAAGRKQRRSSAAVQMPVPTLRRPI